jgi:hypothetical protein
MRRAAARRWPEPLTVAIVSGRDLADVRPWSASTSCTTPAATASTYGGPGGLRCSRRPRVEPPAGAGRRRAGAAQEAGGDRRRVGRAEALRARRSFPRGRRTRRGPRRGVVDEVRGHTRLRKKGRQEDLRAAARRAVGQGRAVLWLLERWNSRAGRAARLHRRRRDRRGRLSSALRDAASASASGARRADACRLLLATRTSWSGSSGSCWNGSRRADPWLSGDARVGARLHDLGSRRAAAARGALRAGQRLDRHARRVRGGRAGGPHYPGTYLAGGYNRLETEIAGRILENEDLVNWPNWLPLTFRPRAATGSRSTRVEVLDFELRLDVRRGVLERTVRFRDAGGASRRS